MRVRFKGGRTERWLWVVNGLLSFCASYGIVYWAELYVPSGLTAVLFATFPLFVALMAHAAIPGERLTPVGGAGVIVGFAGVAVIFSEDLTRLGGPGVAPAAAILLLSPFVSAVANVAIKRWGAGVHPVSLAAVPMGIAAVVMGALAAVVERDATIVLSPRSIGAVVYLAVLGSAVTFTLYYWLLRRVPASRAALIAYVVPVIAVFVGAAFLDEPLTRRTLAGAGLVLVGVGLAARSGRPPQDPSRGVDNPDARAVPEARNPTAREEAAP